MPNETSHPGLGGLRQTSREEMAPETCLGAALKLQVSPDREPAGTTLPAAAPPFGLKILVNQDMPVDTPATASAPLVGASYEVFLLRDVYI